MCSFAFQENNLICCHQMSDFEAKMHQNRFLLGLRPRPRWRSLSAPPDPWLDLRGLSSKGRKDKPHCAAQFKFSRLAQVM